ncbi:GGDEF domain-containing protein [Pseudoalteromonas sp. ZZD1]
MIADNFNGYQYNSPELLSRIILSFIVVALLSGFYEYFRETYSRKLIQLAKSNETLATTDPLTSLPNRRYTMERLYDEKLLSDKSNTSLTIMIVDIDDFKKVNDKYGHQIGDLALTHLADTFRKFSRAKDIFCRWGGEEFLCVLPQTNVEGAVVVAKRIQKDLLAQPIQVEQEKINLFVSVGVSEITRTESIDLAIKKADENLYLAKSTGKNKVYSA